MSAMQFDSVGGGEMKRLGFRRHDGLGSGSWIDRSCSLALDFGGLGGLGEYGFSL
jgi:hypothetical protein